MPAPKSSKEDLYRDLYELGLTPEEVMSKYGYKDYNSFWAATKRRGIPYPHYKVGAAILSPEQRQVVLGTLLGDGYLIHKNGRNCSLRVSQCLVQEELTMFKAGVLHNWVTPGGIRYEKQSHPGRDYQVTFSTYTHPEFTKLRQVFYPDGIKIVPQSILDELGDLGIAVWFMDDGSHMSKARGMRLHVAGFAEDDCLRIVQWFRSSWGIETHLGRTSGGYFVINIYGDHSVELSSICKPHILPGMRYKFDL